MSLVNYSFLIGLGSIALIYMVYGVSSGHWNPSSLYKGADGRFSLSKFQWWLWIWVIAFAYVTMYVARSLVSGKPADPITDIPGNILGILGISTGVMTVAKGVTSSYVSSGILAKTAAKGAKTSDLVSDDAGTPDLSRLQMFIWTWIAVVIYLLKVASQVVLASKQPGVGEALEALAFPDLDSSLLVLSGLSATGYIAQKVVTRQAPKIGSVTPSEASRDGDVAIIVLGSNFGLTQGDSSLCIGANVDFKPVTQWGDGCIKATIPSGFPQGTHLISVIVCGYKSNEVTIQLN